MTDSEQKRRLIVAEDNSSEREILAQTLVMMGYEVTAVENGHLALEAFKARGADLIMSDIQMPQMSGLELLRAVRDSGHDLPFIILTGFDTAEARDFASNYRATALLIKPFRLLHLKSLLESTLSRHG